MSLPCRVGYVICPYDPSHTILASRLQFHLVKCKAAHKQAKMVECPFNSTHKVPETNLHCHKEFQCSDRKSVDTFLYSTEKSTSLFPIKKYVAPTSENWDDSEAPTYDPIANCKKKPVLLNLQGATASERKNFRAEERQRYRKLTDTAPSDISEESRNQPINEQKNNVEEIRTEENDGWVLVRPKTKGKENGRRKINNKREFIKNIKK